ncbi:ParA family protein (plasmid) [Streptomycetaceae bacterium NBC_01309]
MTMSGTAMLNQKGGVGKTTDTAGLAGALAAAGKRVLVVDYDPQGNLTSALKAPRLVPSEKPGVTPTTLTQSMIHGCSQDQARALVHRHSDRLHVIPWAIDMYKLNRQLYSVRAGTERLRRVLELLAEDYDECIVDCRPALDLDTDNALEYAENLLVPVEVDEFCIEALDQLWEQVKTLEAELRLPPRVWRGLVISRVNLPLSAFLKEVRKALHAYSPPRTEGVPEDFVLPVVGEILVRTAFPEAKNKGQTIDEYEPRSDAAKMFRDLAVKAGYLEAAA